MKSRLIYMGRKIFMLNDKMAILIFILVLLVSALETGLKI